MKILHTLICSIFLSLQYGNVKLVSAMTFTEIKGENITIKCPFSSLGPRKFFCKEPCKGANILTDTTLDSAQNGRYSSKYVRGSGSRRTLYVTITQLVESDTGRYRCGLGTAFHQFGIEVVGALLGKNRDPSEDKRLYTRAGRNLTVGCHFPHSGTTKFFCMGPCTENNVLVQTNSNTDQRGRYSIRYVRNSFTETFVYVTITQLTESDSGLYRCGLHTSHHEFEISVTDAPSTTQSSTRPTSLFALPEITDQSGQQYNETIPEDKVMLYVGLALVLAVLLLSVVLLTFCRKRSAKAKETPADREYASIPQPNQVYEDVREEDRQSRVYTDIKCTKPLGVENNDDYSFVTAATSQHKDGDETSMLTYSEVNFSNRTSPNSAPRGRDNDVIYSVPRV